VKASKNEGTKDPTTIRFSNIQVKSTEKIPHEHQTAINAAYMG